MKNFTILLYFFGVLNCQEKQKSTSERASIPVAEKTAEKKAEISKEESLKLMNTNLLQFLKTQNFAKFSSYIHPKKGVTFSMYAFVKPDSDKCFTQKEFMEFYPKPSKFTWGEKDGTGDLYIETIQNYFINWLWKKDFSSSKYELNGKISHGNSLDNAKEIYPESDVTINFIPGTKEFSEMDWHSLGFVFEEFEGKYYLIAVINDQWTI